MEMLQITSAYDLDAIAEILNSDEPTNKCVVVSHAGNMDLIAAHTINRWSDEHGQILVLIDLEGSAPDEGDEWDADDVMAMIDDAAMQEGYILRWRTP